jgi:hypothetical protein
VAIEYPNISKQLIEHPKSIRQGGNEYPKILKQLMEYPKSIRQGGKRISEWTIRGRGSGTESGVTTGSGL